MRPSNSCRNSSGNALGYPPIPWTINTFSAPRGIRSPCPAGTRSLAESSIVGADPSFLLNTPLPLDRLGLDLGLARLAQDVGGRLAAEVAEGRGPRRLSRCRARLHGRRGPLLGLDRQDGARRKPDDPFGGASHEDAGHARSTVGPHDDQVDPVPLD